MDGSVTTTYADPLRIGYDESILQLLTISLQFR